MALPLISSTMNKSVNAIEIYRGESRNVEVDVTETVTVGGVTFDQAADLTGAVIYFTVKTVSGYPVAKIAKTSATSDIVISIPATLGKAVVKIMPDDTKYLGPSTYVYDIWVLFSGGRKIPVVEVAEFKVKDAVTII